MFAPDMTFRTLIVAAALSLPTICGCVPLALGTQPLGGGPAPTPPEARITNTVLRQRPSEAAIGLHYCYEHAPIALMCRPFGPRPTPTALGFAFDVTLELKNPSPFPMPLVQALLAFTAFPEAHDQENLGAVCMSLCDPEAPAGATACRQAGEAACRSDEPEIRGLEDFAAASANFLVATALGERSFDDLRVRTIPAGGQIAVVVRVEVAYEQMLRLIEASVGNAMDGALQGRFPQLVVPYRLEGSVWVTVENFGRFAAGFGPVEGSWDLGEALANEVTQDSHATTP